jgi:hypothetical protein
MALIEIMANAFSQYRSGVVYAIQSGDFDAAIVFLKGMIAMLPKTYQPQLPPIPVPTDIKTDFFDKGQKWRWCTESAYKTEEAISNWIQTNLARMNM